MDTQRPDAEEALLRDSSGNADGDNWVLVKETNSEDEMESHAAALPEDEMDHSSEPEIENKMEPQEGELGYDEADNETPPESPKFSVCPYADEIMAREREREKKEKALLEDRAANVVGQGGERVKLDDDNRIETVESHGDGTIPVNQASMRATIIREQNRGCMDWFIGIRDLVLHLCGAEEEEENDEQALIPDGRPRVNPMHYECTKVVISVVVLGMMAILAGNFCARSISKISDNAEYTQQILELKNENELLRKELGNYKRLYSRVDLENQVQQANRNFEETLAKVEKDAQVELDENPDLNIAKSPRVRIVPHQDDDLIPRRVVWSGVDEEPMIILEKDFVLPPFCNDKNAFKDGMYNEFAQQHCDISRRKIDAKLHRLNYLMKSKKRIEPINYKKYIYPTKEEIAEQRRRATAAPVKVPHMPSRIGKAYETVKEEVSVVLQSLAAILDMDPKPDEISQEQHGYSADDEGSSTGSETMINWREYPPWVREKYEHQPEMHNKLKHKAHLIWDWQRLNDKLKVELKVKDLKEAESIPEEELQRRKRKYYELNDHVYTRTPEEMGNSHEQSKDDYRKHEHPRDHNKHHGKHNREHNGKHREHNKHFTSDDSSPSGDGAYPKQYQNSGKHFNDNDKKHHQKEWNEPEHKHKDYKKENNKYDRSSGEGSDKHWKDDKRKNDDYKDSGRNDHENVHSETMFKHHEHSGQSSGERSRTKPYHDEHHEKHHHDNHRGHSDDDDDDDNDEHYKHRHPDKRDHDRDHHKHNQHKNKKREHHNRHEDERWNKRHDEDKWRSRDQHHSGERHR